MLLLKLAKGKFNYVIYTINPLFVFIYYFYVRNVKKSTEKINQMEKEISDLEEKLKQIKEEKKKLTLDGAEIQKDLEEVCFFSFELYS